PHAQLRRGGGRVKQSSRHANTLPHSLMLIRMRSPSHRAAPKRIPSRSGEQHGLLPNTAPLPLWSSIQQPLNQSASSSNGDGQYTVWASIHTVGSTPRPCRLVRWVWAQSFWRKMKWVPSSRSPNSPNRSALPAASSIPTALRPLENFRSLSMICTSISSALPGISSMRPRASAHYMFVGEHSSLPCFWAQDKNVACVPALKTLPALWASVLPPSLPETH